MFMYFRYDRYVVQDVKFINALCIGDHWSVTWDRDADGNVLWDLTEVNGDYPRLLELGDFVLDEPCIPGWDYWWIDPYKWYNAKRACLPLTNTVPHHDRSTVTWARDEQGDVDLTYNNWGGE